MSIEKADIVVHVADSLDADQRARDPALRAGAGLRRTPGPHV